MTTISITILPRIQWRANFPEISAFQTNLSSSFVCSYLVADTEIPFEVLGGAREKEHSWLSKSTIISIRAHLSILYFFTHLKRICRFIVVCIISSFNSVLNQDLQWLYRFVFFFGSAKRMMIPSTENNRTILIRSYISFLLIQRTQNYDQWSY